MRTFAIVSLLLLMLIPTPAAVSHDGHEEAGLEVSNAWARKTRRTVSAAVYFEIKNGTHRQEVLEDVATERAGTSMIHRSYEEDGVMRMDMQHDVPIAPGETLAFAPGGYHVMLMQLTEPLTEGDVFPLTLMFRQAGEVTIYVTVTGLGGPAGN